MLRTKQPSTFSKIKGHKHNIFSFRIGQDKMGKSVWTSPQHQYRLLHHNHCQWWDLNSQPLGYKPSALAIELQVQKLLLGRSWVYWVDVLHYYIFIIAQLWLTFHQRNTVVLLDTGTPGTRREIFNEDADGETRPLASSLKISLLVPGDPMSSRTNSTTVEQW